MLYLFHSKSKYYKAFKLEIGKAFEPIFMSKYIYSIVVQNTYFKIKWKKMIINLVHDNLLV